jgi:hypothetical protein
MQLAPLRFGFLAEALAFWRKHLHDDDEEGGNAPLAPQPPGVRVHVQRPPLRGAPVATPERADGYWVAEVGGGGGLCTRLKPHDP